MKTMIKNIAASVMIAGTFAFSSAVAQVEGQDQMETQDPSQDPTLDQPQGQEQQQQQQGQEQKQREEIEITEVPSAVSEKLNSGEFQDMQVTRAYKVTDQASGEVFYEVHFTNAQGTTEKKKFNEEGEEVKKDKKDDY